MKKIKASEFAEWSGTGQFRKVLIILDQVILAGGVNPVLGRRSDFHAIAVSLDVQSAQKKWSMTIDKSHSFQHAVQHGTSLILTIPSNFTHGFTGYLEVDIATGVKESQLRFEDVILGVASLDGKLVFGTAIRGEYRVFSCEKGERTDFPRSVESPFWLEALAGISDDRMVISEFDPSLSKLIHIHSAFNRHGQALWKFESCFLNISSLGNRLLNWDSESLATEVVDPKTGQLHSVIELAGKPLEAPVAIGEFGFAYACPDCSVRIRSWDGIDQEIFRQPTSGSIALAYDNMKKVLVAAFSGNNTDTNTQVRFFKIEDI